MPKEDDSLLEDQDYYREEKESTWPGKIRACLWCIVCILLVGSTIFAVLALMRYFKGECADDNDVDLSKLGFPKNLSDLLAANSQLCKKVSNKDKLNLNYGPSNIYIIKSEKNLTNEQACGIESILRLFPDKTIYLIDFNRHENRTYVKCSTNQNYLGLLLYLYKDRLQVIPATRADYFKNTPLQNFPIADDDFVFLAMILTAYKYGGFVASPNTIMTSRELLECMPEETIVDPVAIITSRKCDDFLHYLMQSFNLCERDNSTLDSVVNTTVRLYTQSHNGKAPVRRLSSTEVCRNVKKPCMFLRLQQFDNEPTKWLGDLSAYCKQVVQAFLGIKINQMEVEEETFRMKNKIGHSGKKCERVEEPEEKTV